MIDNVIRDSAYFLGLALLILVGFALGLRVLLRHVAHRVEREEAAVFDPDGVPNIDNVDSPEQDDSGVS